MKSTATSTNPSVPTSSTTKHSIRLPLLSRPARPRCKHPGLKVESRLRRRRLRSGWPAHLRWRSFLLSWFVLLVWFGWAGAGAGRGGFGCGSSRVWLWF